MFWGLVGIGLGAVVGAQVVRWAGRTKQRYAPPTIAREAVTSLQGLASRVKDAVDVARTEMSEREPEIRAQLGLPPR